ncbi:hypothetical protein [Bradyrhizobium sp. BR 1432]|uniref:hypothetical protein n=1 Tax=Bradyrhizobium sp. BR 1432 TaxID=3447966 RepID=UPI003EE589F9
MNAQISARHICQPIGEINVRVLSIASSSYRLVDLDKDVRLRKFSLRIRKSKVGKNIARADHAEGVGRSRTTATRASGRGKLSKSAEITYHLSPAPKSARTWTCFRN